MSRQRIRTGVLEGSTAPCPHCAGSGMVRSTASVALHVLRVLEDALIKSSAHNITVRTRAEVALYILNQKRANLSDLEQRFGVCVTIVGDDTLTGTAYHAMERGEPATGVVESRIPDAMRALETPLPIDEAELEEGEEEEAEAHGRDESEGGEGGRRRRRRRRRRGGRDRDTTGIAANAPQPSDDALAAMAQFGRFPDATGGDAVAETAGDEESSAHGSEGRRDGRRRRGRGGRGRGPRERGTTPVEADWPADAEVESFAADLGPEEAESYSASMIDGLEPHVSDTPAQEERSSHAKESAKAEPEAEAVASESTVEAVDPNRPKRTGWWQRAKASI